MALSSNEGRENETASIVVTETQYKHDTVQRPRDAWISAIFLLVLYIPETSSSSRVAGTMSLHPGVIYDPAG